MKKKIAVGDDDVDVEVMDHPAGKNSLKIVATCRGEVHEHSVTLGPVDRPLPDDYDIAQARKDIDEASDFAARMAASHARRKELISRLVTGGEQDSSR